jgi:hypothetical protein
MNLQKRVAAPRHALSAAVAPCTSGRRAPHTAVHFSLRASGLGRGAFVAASAPFFRLAARHRRVPAPRCCPCEGKEGSASGVHDLARDWHQFTHARARSTEANWWCAPLTAPMRLGGCKP